MIGNVIQTCATEDCWFSHKLARLFSPYSSNEGNAVQRLLYAICNTT